MSSSTRPPEPAHAAPTTPAPGTRNATLLRIVLVLAYPVLAHLACGRHDGRFAVLALGDIAAVLLLRPLLQRSAKAWLALAYLVVAGSIIAYTAYVWLIHHESPTKVGTYAYVNPVVAVLLGYFLGGETIGPRTILGTLLVLVSVIVITTARSKKLDVGAQRDELEPLGAPEPTTDN